MEAHSFALVNCDTDGIIFSKSDGAPFDESEIDSLICEINGLLPEKIQFESDGDFPTIIVLAAKNYILYDGEKIKTKGSSLRDQKKEIACREMLDKMISILIHGEPQDKLLDTYNSYIKEALNVKEIKRWCSKKTITEKTKSSTRANETKLKDAIVGSEYVQADKVYVFFKSDESLCLAEKFDGDYNKKRLLEKLFKTTQVFKSILPVKELFKNYSLKKNTASLESLK